MIYKPKAIVRGSSRPSVCLFFLVFSYSPDGVKHSNKLKHLIPATIFVLKLDWEYKHSLESVFSLPITPVSQPF